MSRDGEKERSRCCKVQMLLGFFKVLCTRAFFLSFYVAFGYSEIENKRRKNIYLKLIIIIHIKKINYYYYYYFE